jgi:hypothetical protein
MSAECGVAELLRAGGPVRVPLRACCAAALVGRKSAVERCAAAIGDAPAALEASGVLDASGAGK